VRFRVLVKPVRSRSISGGPEGRAEAQTLPLERKEEPSSLYSHSRKEKKITNSRPRVVEFVLRGKAELSRIFFSRSLRRQSQKTRREERLPWDFIILFCSPEYASKKKRLAREGGEQT